MTLDAREAQRSYEANLRMFDQTRQMTQSLVDPGKKIRFELQGTSVYLSSQQATDRVSPSIVKSGKPAPGVIQYRIQEYHASV